MDHTWWWLTWRTNQIGRCPIVYSVYFFEEIRNYFTSINTWTTHVDRTVFWFFVVSTVLSHFPMLFAVHSMSLIPARPSSHLLPFIHVTVQHHITSHHIPTVLYGTVQYSAQLRSIFHSITPLGSLNSLTQVGRGSSLKRTFETAISREKREN